MADKFRWFELATDSQSFQEQLPEGEVRRMYVNARFICISRHKNKWHAFEDKCPHQGKTLLGATCDAQGMLTCPHHKYTFDLETGRGHGMFINKYAVREENSKLYVGFKRGFLDFL